MAQRKKGRGVKASPKAGAAAGAVRVVIYLRPEQLRALQDHAIERARERGAVSVSVSDAARSIIEDWIERKG
jgi:hypothetical protein